LLTLVGAAAMKRVRWLPWRSLLAGTVVVLALAVVLRTGPEGTERTGPSAIGSARPPSSSTPPASIAPAATALGRSSAASARPTAGSAAVTARLHPWTATIPTGTGTIEEVALPAPWIAGHVSQAHLFVYLPAGYRTTARRYPVLYAVPWDLTEWESNSRIVELLNALVHNGTIPPMLVIFVDLSGSPFPNSECAGSANGLEHADTYASMTVVAWVDRHLRTIADPRARTLFGFSQGGFCAMNLLLRHPDVFANAIAFSGYYVAGLRSSQTVNAWQPWGKDAALIAANSPLVVAKQLSATIRQRLFIVLSAAPTEPIYGPQATALAAELQTEGYGTDLLWTPLGHRWKAVQAEVPVALAAVAARQAANGVFGTTHP
jgi:enterochelin esterase-like enzyme